MKDEYIRKQEAIDVAMEDGKKIPTVAIRIMHDIKAIPAADVVPYSIDPDGTVTITVPNGIYKKVKRVLVEEDGTHLGGLYYAD